ncbi:MAG: lipid-A-disaccharide synthase [Bacteroidaceae bacterium]|nr:lipid-A-disaccharide synthase [Bacteroidaceae bacterium]
MKYFLIVGEASGDLHAAHLMKALKQQDSKAEFQFYGGDEMLKEGGTLLCHYKYLAYMGFIPVLLHLRTILKGMADCKEQIKRWKPDCVILVDYPGFNLKIAKFVKTENICPVYYYISPKIWAWKEHRIKDIRAYVDRLFSILPFEVDFFEKKHQYPISYVGNPTADEVYAFKAKYTEDYESFCERNGLDPSKKIIALLAGSRKQEIKDNLCMMCEAARTYVCQGYQLVLAGAPSISLDYYREVLGRLKWDEEQYPLILRQQTYSLLSHATVALVTSGTATLETALFDVPQIVCYYTPIGKVISFLRKHLLKVKYISLVNLVAGKEVVPELVADTMTHKNIVSHLGQLLPGGIGRVQQLQGYAQMKRILGDVGAPQHAAQEMIERLQ